MDIPSLTLVTHGEEKFARGTHDAVLSTHGKISIFMLGDINRIAPHKLTDRGVEVIIRSSHYEQVTGNRRAGNKACAIRLGADGCGHRHRRGWSSCLGLGVYRRHGEKHYR